MNDIYKSPEYRRSRVAYHIQCVTEYLAGLLVADAFLAKLLKNIGLSDSTIGIVASLMSLAFLIQLQPDPGCGSGKWKYDVWHPDARSAAIGRNVAVCDSDGNRL